MSKFKIGDKVKLVNSTTDFKAGEIFEVVGDYPSFSDWIRKGVVELDYMEDWEFELVEAAHTSNETPSLAKKTTPKNDDSGERDSQPRVDNNSWFERGELPPIGTECLVTERNHPFTKQFSGKRVIIIAHIRDGDDMVAVFQVEGFLKDIEARYHALIAGCFRPIKTAEEMEAEARKKAVGAVEEQILEQMGELNVRNLAEHIVDTFDLRFTKEE